PQEAGPVRSAARVRARASQLSTSHPYERERGHVPALLLPSPSYDAPSRATAEAAAPRSRPAGPSSLAYHPFEPRPRPRFAPGRDLDPADGGRDPDSGRESGRGRARDRGLGPGPGRAWGSGRVPGAPPSPRAARSGAGAGGGGAGPRTAPAGRDRAPEWRAGRLRADPEPLPPGPPGRDPARDPKR